MLDTKRPVGRPRVDTPSPPPEGITVSVRGIDSKLWTQARAHALLNRLHTGELINLALAEYLETGAHPTG